MSSYFISLFLSTFVLEDVALLTGVVFVAQQKIPFMQSFMACFFGIAMGDLAIYFLGRLTAQNRFLSQTRIFAQLQKKFSDIDSDRGLGVAIFIARFIPGTRIVTYTLAGFTKFPVFKYLGVNLASGLIWVTLVFQIGISVYRVFTENIFVALVVFFILITLIRYLIKNAKNFWQRKIIK